MRALVTGISGFIGSCLARTLVEQGVEVVGLARPSSRLDKIPRDRVRLVEGELADEASLARAVADVDIVYHLAGVTKSLHRHQFEQVNARGAVRVATICAQRANPPVLLFVSSLAAAGPSPLGRLRVETDPLAPVSIYGGSKLAGERLIAPLAGKLPITIVRPPIVFGYGDENIAEFYRTMRRTGMHLVPGSGSGRFSLIEVHDLVEGIRLAAERGARLETTSLTDGRAQGVYFLGGDEHPTYYELGERIARAIGSRKLRVVRIPEWMAWIAAATSELNSQVVRRPALLNFDKVRELTAGSWACSSQRATAELGFRVARSLDERLAEVAAVYVAADRG